MRERVLLCGYDRVTEREFDCRRGWIEDLLAYLAGVFATVRVLPRNLPGYGLLLGMALFLNHE